MCFFLESILLEIISFLGFCGLGLCHIQNYVAFGIPLFMIISFGFMSFGIMSFGILSVYCWGICLKSCSTVVSEGLMSEVQLMFNWLPLLHIS